MSSAKMRAVESMKRDLLRESQELLSKDHQRPLTKEIRRLYPDCMHAFVLDWVPEQGEDIYWVLISPTKIAKIEISRLRSIDEHSSKAISEIISLKEYSKKPLTRVVRRRLDAASSLTSDKTSKI
jgi:hypothetical protein